MKIFLDTAHVASIQKWASSGLIDGVTTNPSSLSKEGGDPKKHILDICALLPEGDISVEVTETDPHKIYQQAHEIAALADNVVVKVPCHSDYIPVIHRLVSDGIPLNITLVFSLTQALLMCKLQVDYISPFIGRLDDAGSNGLELIENTVIMLDNYEFETQLLAASIRSVDHVNQVIQLGADVITMPVAIFEQLCAHPLTDQGIAKFNQDWQKLGIKQFP